ncbi:hypothetical protein LAZ40_01455 [Cereibacter sphaeroides]|uniref:hypothetical protein n=1 Tax=Cereibacter sphaeroides TaxID=1063 RepID=UPI001F3502CF|nr:hypothetical protein [Cereibacter sphaeroides]MCE6957726.1 hypothetical protein [Cereibacter sphaeroides]MCE6971512.1 hypothetical protein [Cereibacter sphaeroides]
MTDQEIIEALKAGEELNFGCHGRNGEIMALMADLEQQGLIETWDLGLSQETRRGARWIGPKDEMEVPVHG